MTTPTPHYDIVLKSDRVIDPASGHDGPAQIGIVDGRIAAFRVELGPHTAGETVDASAQIVSPGLIDIHVHVYEWVTNFGLAPDDAGIHSG